MCGNIYRAICRAALCDGGAPKSSVHIPSFPDFVGFGGQTKGDAGRRGAASESLRVVDATSTLTAFSGVNCQGVGRCGVQRCDSLFLSSFIVVKASDAIQFLPRFVCAE